MRTHRCPALGGRPLGEASTGSLALAFGVMAVLALGVYGLMKETR